MSLDNFQYGIGAVITPDQQAAFTACTQNLIADTRPENFLEQLIVDQLLHAQWELHRVNTLALEDDDFAFDPDNGTIWRTGRSGGGFMSPTASSSMRVRGSPVSPPSNGKPISRTTSAASAAASTGEPARRSSSCRSPMAFSGLSERRLLEQTSSARRSLACAIPRRE